MNPGLTPRWRLSLPLNFHTSLRAGRLHPKGFFTAFSKYLAGPVSAYGPRTTFLVLGIRGPKPRSQQGSPKAESCCCSIHWRAEKAFPWISSLYLCGMQICFHSSLLFLLLKICDAECTCWFSETLRDCFLSLKEGCSPNPPVPPGRTRYFFPVLLCNICFIFGRYQSLLIAVIQLFTVYSLKILAQCASMSPA